MQPQCLSCACTDNATQDATLKRCFGIDKRLLDCDWDFVKTVRSIAPPHEPIARLEELLEYLAAEAQQTWVLLDIKVRVRLSRFAVLD